MEYQLTKEDKKLVAEYEILMKRELGGRDIEHCLNEETELFDRRRFGKLTCPFCGKQFNPFYYKSLKEGEWNWVWRFDSHKEPEQRNRTECPKCKEELFFEIYIGQ